MAISTSKEVEYLRTDMEKISLSEVSRIRHLTPVLCERRRGQLDIRIRAEWFFGYAFFSTDALDRDRHTH